MVRAHECAGLIAMSAPGHKSDAFTAVEVLSPSSDLRRPRAIWSWRDASWIRWTSIIWMSSRAAEKALGWQSWTGFGAVPHQPADCDSPVTDEQGVGFLRSTHEG